MSTSIARVRFLGTGTSHGVPMIGCRCPTCRSDDPRDRRWRASLHVVFAGGLSALVDTPPDLRSQVLAFGVESVDVVLFTHAHADHILGLDDVRAFNERQRSAISCYGDAETIAEVERVFAYTFRRDHVGGWLPRLRLFPVAGPFCLARQLVVPIPIWHGPRKILGYRIGDFAYLTDCSGIPDESRPLIEGVGTLVIGALRHTSHPTHFTVAEALSVIEAVGPRRALLTHLCHDLGHAATAARLPAGVDLAYDGLVFDVHPPA